MQRIVDKLSSNISDGSGCCCLSSEIATYVVGCLWVISGVSAIGGEIAGVWITAVVNSTVGTILFSLGLILTGGCLTYGVYKRNAYFVLQFIVINAAFVIILIIAILVRVVNELDPKKKNFEHKTASLILFGVLLGLVICHAVRVVNRYYKTMRISS